MSSEIIKSQLNEAPVNIFRFCKCLKGNVWQRLKNDGYAIESGNPNLRYCKRCLSGQELNTLFHASIFKFDIIGIWAIL